jgi:hypothetical protein
MPGTAGVIDFFLHPTLNLITSSTTSPSAIANPLTGHNVLAASVGLSSSFGVVCAVSLAPPEAGLTLGTINRYEDPVSVWTVFHTLASGLVVVTQRAVIADANYLLFWDVALPTNVIVDVFPNFELTVEWLVGV